MAIVFLGLGSNTGDREKNIQEALEELKRAGLAIAAVSKIIETKPEGGPPQDNFLNAVLKAATKLKPQELLGTINRIEAKLGRKRIVVNGPRTIDIDILLYDHLIYQTPSLTIPHPRMLKRDFVMLPLKEIAPEIEKELPDAHRA